MSIKDRLKIAYENVALNGDKTWMYTSNSYQKANQRLYSREYQLNNIKIIEERPRTVKDSIPNSKLATYADYEYNEARELCYTRTIYKTNFEYLSRKMENQMVGEPWALPEVDDLFIWFLYCQNHSRNDFGPFEYCKENLNNIWDAPVYEVNVESPLLTTYGFQEKKLKMHITSDKVKMIWKTIQCNTFHKWVVVTKDKTLNIHKLPNNMFLVSENSEDQENGTEYLEIAETSTDFDHLKNLAKSFKEQNTWISKCSSKCTGRLLPMQTAESCSSSKIESFPSRRLYSAVLQGLTSNEKPVVKKTELVTQPKISFLEEKEKPDAIPLPITNFGTCTSSISSLTVFNAQSQSASDAKDTSPVVKKIVLKQDTTKVQKSVSTQSALKIVPKVQSPETSVSSKVFTNSREYNHSSEDVNLRNINPLGSTFISTPITHSYVNNYNYQFNAHYSNTFHNSCGCSNTFSHTSQVITNRNIQTFQRQNTYFPNTYQYPQPVIMLQQNRTSTVYPLTAPVQQSYFYQPVAQPRTMQRWIMPQNYSRSNIPQQNFPSSVSPQYFPQPPAHWINSQQQNQQPVAQTSAQGGFADTQLGRVKSKLSKKPFQPQISILRNKDRKGQEEGSFSTETTDSDNRKTGLLNARSSCSSGELEVLISPLKKEPFSLASSSKAVKSDFEEVVSKTVSLIFEEEIPVPVTSTVSEELEIQALEQYCNSNDNVYQELERQAAEQYEEYSENWKGPPNRDVFVGGLNCHYALVV